MITRWKITLCPTAPSPPPPPPNQFFRVCYGIAHARLYSNCGEFIQYEDTYLRNTVTTQRLSGFGLLNVYWEREISAQTVLDIFVLGATSLGGHSFSNSTRYEHLLWVS